MPLFCINRRGKKEIGLADRIRGIRGAHRRRNYWISVVSLVGLAILSGLIFGPSLRSKQIVLPCPEPPSPAYQLMALKEVQVNKLKGLTVLAQTTHSTKDSLRRVMDWILYSVVNDYNRRRRQQIRVVWIYLYKDSVDKLAQWKAMAIWIDPTLPEVFWPEAARIGGDAVKIGAVEYDFTNPLNSSNKKL